MTPWSLHRRFRWCLLIGSLPLRSPRVGFGNDPGRGRGLLGSLSPRHPRFLYFPSGCPTRSLPPARRLVDFVDEHLGRGVPCSGLQIVDDGTHALVDARGVYFTSLLFLVP